MFQSTESLAAIYEFTKFALAEEHRLAPFLLCTSCACFLSCADESTDQTPPRREFRKADPAMKGKSLMDLELTPSSVFYIKFDDDALNRTRSAWSLLVWLTRCRNGDPTASPCALGGGSRFPRPCGVRPHRRCSPCGQVGRGGASE